MYAGTVADFSATDALIIKNRLRTEQYDLKHLNEPHFVNSLEDEDHVYFFFRESAVEFMNCGKVRKLTLIFWATHLYTLGRKDIFGSKIAPSNQYSRVSNNHT